MKGRWLQVYVSCNDWLIISAVISAVRKPCFFAISRRLRQPTNQAKWAHDLKHGPLQGAMYSQPCMKLEKFAMMVNCGKIKQCCR
jgi:hypothetical protein